LRKPLTFTKPCQVVTEGYADQTFIRRLTENRKIEPLVGAFRTSKDPIGQAFGSGRSGYLDTLNALTTEITFFDVVKGIVILADNDDDPSGRFADVSNQLSDAGYPVPKRPEEIVSAKVHGRNITVSVMMLPKTGTAGCLDSLLLASLPNDAQMACATALMACAAGAMADWPPRKKAEAKLRAVLCSTYTKDPGRELSQILCDIKRCPFDFGSPAFDHVETFLRGFLSRMGVL
jgi:hypothetical protein